MAAPPLPPPPIASTLANPTGLPSMTWARWFQLLGTIVANGAGSGADDDSAYALASGVSALSAIVTGHTSTISTLTADDASQAATLASHATSIATLTADDASHATTLASHTSSIATLTSDDASHATTLASHTASIATLTADDATLTSGLAALTSTVSGLPTQGRMQAQFQGWAMP